MKTLRSLLALAAALMALPDGARAQSTPTYRSFNTNQFYTNGSAPIKININTNFPALVITNIYASNIYVTNIYATNIYASNIVSADLIWTNANPWIAPFLFTNTFRMNTNGGVFAGQGLSSDSWFFTDESVGFASLHDSSKGDSAYNRFFFGAEDHTSAPTNTAYAWFTTHTGAQPELSALFNATVGQSQSSYFQINLRPDAANANLRLYNQNLLTFAVNDVSGYSGVGDQFLSDDGTYKPGAGTTINPTDGFLPYRLNATAFDDSPMYRIDSTTVGVDTVDANVVAVTNLQSGGVIYSRSDGILTNVVNGIGFLFNDGSNTNLVWSGGSLSDICLWTNRSGLLQPVDLTLPLFWTNKVVLGPGSTNVLYRLDSNLIYTNGATTGNGVNIQVVNGSAVRAMFGVDQDEQPFVRSDSGKVFRVEPNNGTPIYTFSSSALYPNGPSDLGTAGAGFAWGSLYLTNQIIWGPGETNVIKRSGTDLVYTNGAPSSSFYVINGNAASVSVGVTTGGHGMLLGGAGSDLYFGVNNNGSGDFVMQSSAFSPNSDNTDSLGGPTFNWKDFYVQQTRFKGITAAQKSAITPAEGMEVFQTDNTAGLQIYQGGAWAGVNTSANFIGMTLPGSGVIYTNVVATNLASGQTTLYTIPSGYRAYVQRFFCGTTNASTTTYYVTLTTNAVTYRITANTSQQVGNFPSSEPGIIFEQGESIGINTSLTGINAFTGLILYTNTFKMYSPRVLGMASGDNTVYTVPASTTAFSPFGVGQINTRGIYVNDSGGARTFSSYFVPNGGTTSSGFRFQTGSAADKSTATLTPPLMIAGDRVVFNTDASGNQAAWMTVFEYP